MKAWIKSKDKPDSGKSICMSYQREKVEWATRTNSVPGGGWDNTANCTCPGQVSNFSTF